MFTFMLAIKLAPFGCRLNLIWNLNLNLNSTTTTTRQKALLLCGDGSAWHGEWGDCAFRGHGGDNLAEIMAHNDDSSSSSSSSSGSSSQARAQPKPKKMLLHSQVPWCVPVPIEDMVVSRHRNP